jgi:hypothetical protein
MTQILSPEDTGDIIRPIDRGETRDLAPHAVTALLNAASYRRPDATGEVPVYAPETIAVVDQGQLQPLPQVRAAAPVGVVHGPVAPLERVATAAELVVPYVGRHRAADRGFWRAVWDRIGGAL